MASGIQDGPSNNGRSSRAHFFSTAIMCLLAVVASTELHESLHWVIGRVVGLPAHFLALTSVGVTQVVAASADPIDLALMNGVAPVATMLLGLLALFAVSVLRRGAPAAVTEFVAWCAIFAIPYIGIQTMLTAAPIRLRGDGADSAAVIGGYFGLSAAPRTLISLAGLAIYMASGFWLRRAVSDRTDIGYGRFTLAQRLKALSIWRIVASSILGLLLVVIIVRSAMLLSYGNARGIPLILQGGPFVWAGMIALLVLWRTPQAGHVRDKWIFPGLLACVVLIVIGILSHTDDYSFLGEVLLLPLISAAW
jgi:hypothetical protein